MGKPSSLKYRLAALITFLLALAGIAIYQTSRESVHDPPEQAPNEQTTPSRPTTEATSAGPDPELQPPTSPVADRTVKRRAARAHMTRIYGTVSDGDGEAIGRAHLRWIKLTRKGLSDVSHDALLGPRLQGASASGDGVGEAIARSRTVWSDPRGGYEIRIPQGDSPGSIVASAPGHERAIHDFEAPVQKDSLRVDFHLAPAGSISGKVTESISGKPARGMRVSAQRLEPARGPGETIGPLAPSAMVAGDGRYTIEGLPPGSYRVAPRTGPSAYAYLSYNESRSVDLSGGTRIREIDFQVEVGGIIQARVSDEKNRPVRSAQCMVLPPRENEGGEMRRWEDHWLLRHRQRETGFGGRCQFQGLPVGKTYQLVCTAKGYATTGSAVVELTGQSRRESVTLVLRRGYSISGIVSYEDGTAASSAEVHFMGGGEFAGALSKPSRTVAGDDGAFAFHNLRPGRYGLHAGDLTSFPGVSFGFADAPPGRPMAMTTETEEPFEVVLGDRDLTGVELTMEQPGAHSVAGIVLDDLGEPVHNAMVRTQGHRRGRFSFVRTDRDGGFEIGGLHDRIFEIAAFKENHTPAKLEVVEADSRDLELTIDRKGWISGFVRGTDASNDYSGNLKVRRLRDARDSTGGDRRAEFARTMAQMQFQFKPGTSVGSDGSFRIESPSGRVEIKAIIQGYEPVFSRPVDVKPGQRISGITIDLSKGAVIRGRVTDPSGSPIEGARVGAGEETGDRMQAMMLESFAMNSEVLTDPQGRFEIPDLKVGRYRVFARHREYAPAEPVTVEIREKHSRAAANLILRRGARISGRVLQDGRPKAGLHVSLGPVSRAGRSAGAACDKEGRFEIENLEPGDYHMQVYSGSGRKQTILDSRQLSLERGEDRHIEISVAGGYRVFGAVRIPYESRLIVHLRKPGPDVPPNSIEARLRAVATLSLGGAHEFEFKDIPSGEYALDAYVMEPPLEESGGRPSLKRVYSAPIVVADRDLQHDISGG